MTRYFGAGDGLSKSKSFYVNVKEKFGFLGDGSDETSKFDLMQTFANSASLLGGCTLAFPSGIYGTTKTFNLPRYVSIIGEGAVSSEIKLLNAGPSQTPQDVIYSREKVNVGGQSVAKIEQIRITNRTFANNFPKWTPNTNYVVGQNIAPRTSTGVGNIVLRCVKAGQSGPRSPIGELTPNNTGSKLVGVANAPCQPIYRVVTPGIFPVTQFQISTDAGVNWGPVLNTTDSDLITYPLPAFGPTFGVQIVCANWEIKAPTTANSFVTPIVGASVVVTVANAANIDVFSYIFIAGAGLMQVFSKVGNNVTLLNVGTDSMSAPGTVIPNGALVTTNIYAPWPRVEVLGTPPADNYIVDVITQFGSLGNPYCTFNVGRGAVATVNKWRAGLAVTALGFQPTADLAFFDYVIPGIGGVLTLRLHTGLYSSSGSWAYFTPSFGWSTIVGTRINDGTAIWEVIKGPACFRSDGAGALGFDSVWLTGGMFNAVFSQTEGTSFSGRFLLSESASACIWYTNRDGRPGEGGGFTNVNSIEGDFRFSSGGRGIIHDGGLGFSIGGAINFQSTPVGWCYFAGLNGASLSGIYLETIGGLVGNNNYFSRNGAGLGLNGLSLSGSYLGSSTGPIINFYSSNAVEIKGCSLGPAQFAGVGFCSNFDLSACSSTATPIDTLPINGDVRGANLSSRLSLRHNNNLAPANLLIAPPAGSYTISAYVAIRPTGVGTSGAITINAIFTDTSGVARIVPIVTYPSIAVLGGEGGRILIDCNGLTNVQYSITGIITPGALDFDFILSISPERN